MRQAIPAFFIDVKLRRNLRGPQSPIERDAVFGSLEVGDLTAPLVCIVAQIAVYAARRRLADRTRQRRTADALLKLLTKSSGRTCGFKLRAQRNPKPGA